MDDHTLEKLEFDSVRGLLARHASSALGCRIAERIAPSRRVDQVRSWLAQLAEFERWVAAKGHPPLAGVRDVRDMVRRAVPPAKLEPEDFATLAETLDGAAQVRAYLTSGADAPDRELPASMLKLAERVGDFRVITERIHRVIDERGRVRDHASDRLARIRVEIERIRLDTRAVFDRLLKQQHIVRHLQYANATFHADRMVLPLKADQRGRIPGIVHRSSDTGQTLFVEPAEAVELNNARIRMLQEESEEIGRILWELTHLVHVNQQEILRTLDAVAVIDLLSAKVRMARQYDMALPEISDDRRLVLREARNPILLMRAGETTNTTGATDTSERRGAGPGSHIKTGVVPIDVRLGEDFDVLMITGPNTGGKTAALKTVGLIALMAQSGLPIPAAPGSRVPVFDGIWIDVGDEQSLQQSLSTFSGHLTRILDIIRRAHPRSLVLLDELGAGTDPDEGAAIGRAIVHHLLSAGGLAMVTTHLGSLKALALETKRVENAAVLFDVETLRPTYDLRIGEPGISHAIAVAQRLGMPRRLIDAAKRHLADSHRALNRAIGRSLASKREAERARRDAESARAESARATLTAMDRARELEKQIRDHQAWFDRVLRLQAGERVRVKSFDQEGRVVRVRLDKQQVSVDLGTMQVDVALTDVVIQDAQATQTNRT